MLLTFRACESVKPMSSPEKLKDFLEKKYKEYDRPAFIETDPIAVPHRFRKKQDIEIAGFFAALFAWGGRPTIIRKATELMQLMDNDPHRFCLDFTDTDFKRLTGFRHRTFNTVDLYYFLEFLRHHYSHHQSLETAFTQWMLPDAVDVGDALTGFHRYFFSLENAPRRTQKHIATPARNSGCKRLNMFLRWMVRRDAQGVDFGIWKKIKPSQLVCPLDVHVLRVAFRFQLLQREKADWPSALELTHALKKFDARDPVKYDFALFGLGVMEKF